MTSMTFFLIFIPLLAFILLAVNLIFAPHNPYQEKDSAFECGFHSFLEQNRTQFSISFFIFALLFLLFDLEILLIYPYVVSSYTNGIYGLTLMLVFFLALTLGFAFELGKNALKIDSKQMISLRNNNLNITNYTNNIISNISFIIVNWLPFIIIEKNLTITMNMQNPLHILYICIYISILMIIVSIILLMENNNDQTQNYSQKESETDSSKNQDDIDPIKLSIFNKLCEQMAHNGRLRSRKCIYQKNYYSESATLNEVEKIWLNRKFMANYPNRYILKPHAIHGEVLVRCQSITGVSRARAIYPSAHLLVDVQYVV